MKKIEILETIALLLFLLIIFLFLLDKFFQIGFIGTTLSLVISLILGIVVIKFSIDELIDGKVLVIGGFYLNKKKTPISFYALILFRFILAIFLIIYPVWILFHSVNTAIISSL